MSIQIGRVGLDVALGNPEEWEHQGNEVKWSGSVLAPNLTDFGVLRDQLLGYVDSQDEPVVPVIWSEDATENGYYRIDDVQVRYVTETYNTFYAEFAVSMTRVRTFANPIIEVMMLGNLRVNSHALTTGVPIHGFPSGALEQFVDTIGATPIVRTGEDGSMVVMSGTALGAGATWRHRCSLDPTLHYNNACRITSGSPVRTVVGRQRVLSVQSHLISNGLVRVRLDFTGLIVVESFDGTQWESKSYSLATADVSTTIGSVVAATVLRNSPESCTIRISYALLNASAFAGRCYVDVTLTRGDRIARFVVTSDLAFNWRVRRSSNETGAAITGAVTASVADAAGNLYIIMSAKPKVNDLVIGGIQLSSPGTTWDFGIGAVIGAGGAATGDGSTSVRDQYFWAGNVRQRVVAR